MRMVGGIPTATAGGMLGDPHHLQRPGSAGGLVGGSRPITPSFSNDKDPGQQFVDFNPAGAGLKLFMPSARQDKAAGAGVES